MTGQPDPLDRLTVAELDAGNRLLKADMVTAIQQRTVDRWQGLAILAWLLAKREDPASQLGTFRAMTPLELIQTLGVDTVDDPAVGVGDGQAGGVGDGQAGGGVAPPATEDPPAPDADPVEVTRAAATEAVAADPTVPPRASS